MDYAHEIGYWESDVGYAEIFVYFGLIGLIALLIWFIGVLTVRIPSELFLFKDISYFYNHINDLWWLLV